MSNIRKKLLAVLLIVFAAALLAFAGCKVGPDTAQDILDKNELTARVIYYANDGEFNNKENIRSVYFKADTPVLNILQQGFIPADDSNNKYPKNIYVNNTGYLLAGWDYAVIDDRGNPVFIDDDGSDLYMHVFTEAEGDIEIPKDEYSNPLTAFNKNGELVFRSEKKLKVKSRGVPVDFTEKIPDGARWYFVAKWVPDVRLNYVFVCDDDLKVEIDGKEYAKGDIIYQASYGNGSSLNVASYAPEADNATFIKAFGDEECKNEVLSVSKPTDGNDVSVYVKYIKGKWTVVKTPLDVSKMFANLGRADNSFYLLNDIDCSTITVEARSTDLKCTIAGNGNTLKNLSANASNLGADSSVALFGNITAEASITDLKFDNLNVKLKARNNVTVKMFLFCNGVEDKAEISGVELKNVTLKFDDAKRQTVVSNIPYSNGAYVYDNWMFGGLETDSAFMDKYGVTVNGYRLEVILNINEETEIIVSVLSND